MPPCKIEGGCKYPEMPVSSHSCKICRTPVHNFCYQSLTGIQDHPTDGFVCGQGGYCQEEAGHPSSAGPPPNDTPGSIHNCAAGSRYSGGRAVMSASKTCCGRPCHLLCLQLPCWTYQVDVSNNEGTAKGKERANAVNAGVMPSVPPAVLSSNPTHNLTGVTRVAVQANEPATSMSKKFAKSMKDVAPQRELLRIRRINEASKVQIDAETSNTILANTILAAAVNDSVQTYFKSNAFSQALSIVVKSNLFEGAVSEASNNLPVHKSALKKAIDENSASVHGILEKSRQPQLDKATKEFKLAADTAGKVLNTSAQAMSLATEELKGVSAGAEASADPPMEVKGAGRKARGKKASKSAPLDKSGEEEALFSAKAQEKLAGVMSNTFSNTLSTKVDPCFRQLNLTINSGLQNSIQVIGQRSSSDNAVLSKHLEVVAGGLATVAEGLSIVSGAKEL